VLLVPSVALVYMVLLCISKLKFAVHEIVIGASATYAVTILMISALNFLPIPIESKDFFGNFVLAGCLYIFTFRKSKNRLISAHFVFFTMIIAMIGNTLIGVLFELTFNLATDALRDSIYLFAVIILLTFPLCFVLSRYIGNRLHESYAQLSLDVKEKFAYYGFIMSFCTYLLTQINVFAYRLIDDRVLLSSINIVLITSIFIIVFTTMTAYSRSQQVLLELEFKEKSLKDLSDHFAHLESAYDEMRQFRHDHLQLLASMVGFIEKENHEDFKSFLEENIKYAKEALGKLDESVDNLKYVHVPELRGLLAIKFAQALSRGIKLNLDFADPIYEIPVNRMDLSRMVGIVIDNAIEEMSAMDYPEKKLKFGILLEGTDVLIICVNTCLKSPNLEEIFKKNFTTKEPGRGLGLYNLQNMCKSNGNVLCTAYHENQELTLILTIG